MFALGFLGCWIVVVGCQTLCALALARIGG